MPLFDPAAHEPITSTAWADRDAEAAVERIVERTLDAYEPNRFWPRHALDEYGSTSDRDTSLWIGAAGVLWALDRLGAGLGEAGVYERYLDEPQFPGSAGLMMGELGVALVSWSLAPTVAKERRLVELIGANEVDPSNELFNGAAGAMFAALHVYERTDTETWRELCRRCAATLVERFRVDDGLGCRIWIQDRRGRLVRSVGAGHGFASNIRSLLRAEQLLTSRTLSDLQRAATETASVLAIEQDGLVNWPTAADAYWAERFPIRVQWCHGAPGVITSLWTLPRDEQLDALLHRAGELVWAAGPLRKGSSLCHGTAGNGCAFLALHERFGEEIWRERARAFAVHAIEQLERATPRYSLWTGDLGAALYVRACADGFDGIPSLDVI